MNPTARQILVFIVMLVTTVLKAEPIPPACLSFELNVKARNAAREVLRIDEEHLQKLQTQFEADTSAFQKARGRTFRNGTVSVVLTAATIFILRRAKLNRSVSMTAVGRVLGLVPIATTIQTFDNYKDMQAASLLIEESRRQVHEQLESIGQEMADLNACGA